MRRLKSGSEDAARALVESHWDAAYSAALLMTHDPQLAEDVAQETVINVIRSIGSFDSRRPLRPWVHRIAVNRSIDLLRSPNGRARPVELEEGSAVAEIPIGVTDPEIAAALMTLEVGDRAAVVLRHVFGYRATEIAELTDETASSTRSRIHRALTRLRAELETTEATR